MLLAAGLGSRFSAGDKLLHPYRGRPLLEWALEPLAMTQFEDRVVVIGPSAAGKLALIERYGLRAIVNPTPQEGMGRSLSLGVLALARDLDGAFICLGDMPALAPSVFNALRERFEACEHAAVIVPCYAGQRGHPVLFGRAHFDALARLTGDQGARAVVAQASAITIDSDVAGILRDVDTVADLT